MTPQEVMQLHRRLVIEACQLLEPALSQAMREMNRAVAEMHEERRRRHPRITDNLHKLHRRYRRRP